MMILKSKAFRGGELLTKFVNENNITRENIFTITRGTTEHNSQTVDLILFYYEEGVYEKEIRIEVQEKKDTWF
jgi:hypothetical protein